MLGDGTDELGGEGVVELLIVVVGGPGEPEAGQQKLPRVQTID